MNRLLRSLFSNRLNKKCMLRSCFVCLLLVTVSGLLIPRYCPAQEIPKPVKWSSTVSPRPFKAGDTLSLRFTGVLENQWFIYATDNDTLDYVSPAVFKFTPHPSYGLLGSPASLNVVLHRDDLLEEDFRVLKNDAVFLQKVIVRRLPLRIDARLDYTLSKEEDEEGTVVVLEELFKIR